MFSCEQVDHYTIVTGVMRKSGDYYDYVAGNIVESTPDWFKALDAFRGYSRDCATKFKCEVDTACCGTRFMRDTAYYAELYAYYGDGDISLLDSTLYTYDDYVRDYD